MPTLGKREREPSPEPSSTSHGGDTNPVKPDDCESAHEFFAHFLSSDKTVSSYPDFVSIATNLFEPGKFIGRAVDAAKEYIATHGGIDDALLERTADDVHNRGLTAVIAGAQQALRLRDRIDARVS